MRLIVQHCQVQRVVALIIFIHQTGARLEKQMHNAHILSRHCVQKSCHAICVLNIDIYRLVRQHDHNEVIVTAMAHDRLDQKSVLLWANWKVEVRVYTLLEELQAVISLDRF